MTEKSIIEFKGTKKGLYIHIKSKDSFDKIKKELIEKLEKTRRFFYGAKIFDIKCESISEEEKKELKELMVNRFNMNVESSGMYLDKEQPSKVFSGIEEGKTKFIKGTVRSGQRINYPGNLLVLGDVNPGAQVIAFGNIVVMGSLRGIAHAGANGNRDAIVAAIHLDPTQLRIADCIARPPDGDYEKPSIPELARVKNNSIHIEPYLIKNKVKDE
ncbi:septum site-determining protein MinC [Serpentinicella alkaliphila]|uniref:Probable septum site-determining protein MinC n=1 Tax=Serpentinicella alkaliphila TaxID=1734049 RepID=A0A4R2TB95_9FIRM|nr:septum site-determining protein MinC [Serpentinicella alkaliphila]QUH26063.1 septum site-determining protein MinC [Serpentinicella alkaliphila]TCP99076.1 septum site-determining protein MinC [Serpentinicella alkaliphila]